MNRFISVGSPHFGTLTAQIAPSSLLRGIAEMKRNSPLLKELNRDVSLLQTIECCSYFCNLDLMVFPGWQAALPLGPRYSVPVLTHKQLISHPVSLEILTQAILYE